MGGMVLKNSAQRGGMVLKNCPGGGPMVLKINKCNDFRDRRLPCKHIYAAALQAGCVLPLSRAEYLSARSQGIEIVFEFDSERPDPLSRF